MSDSSYRIGLVGAGLIGTKRALSLPSNFSLVSIFDTNRQSSHNLAKKLEGSVEIAETIEDLLSKNLSLVIIATTHNALPKIAKQALKAKSNVLIEKPGANELEPLLELQELATANRLKVCVGFNHRFHPSFLKAKQIIDSGQYGKLLWIRARYGHGGRVGYENEWRAQKSLSGGGELLDQGSHLIDLTRMLIGNVSFVFGEMQTAFWDIEVEDNAYIALRPECGGFAWLHASWTEWKNTFSFEVALERAKIDISGLGGSYGPEKLTLFKMQPEMGPPPSDEWIWHEVDTSWAEELNDVVKALEGKDSLVATLDDAIAVHEIIRKAYKK
jgi:predicted dehydrogenase